MNGTTSPHQIITKYRTNSTGHSDYYPKNLGFSPCQDPKMKQEKNITILNYKNLDDLNEKFFTHKPMNKYYIGKFEKKIKLKKRNQLVKNYIDQDLNMNGKKFSNVIGSPSNS